MEPYNSITLRISVNSVVNIHIFGELLDYLLERLGNFYSIRKICSEAESGEDVVSVCDIGVALNTRFV